MIRLLSDCTKRLKNKLLFSGPQFNDLNLIYFQGCGKDLTMIEKDTSRVRYLSPEEGVEYGLIDRVLYPEELRVQVRANTSKLNGYAVRLICTFHT